MQNLCTTLQRPWTGETLKKLVQPEADWGPLHLRGEQGEDLLEKTKVTPVEVKTSNGHVCLIEKSDV